MRDYLMLRLQGPMQAWGTPTFEGARPCALFPTRSGLLGLLAACQGIGRSDRAALLLLAQSVRFAVRCDANESLKAEKITDFHTIKDARVDYQSLKSHETIITRREYLCDACFTVAVWSPDDDSQTLNTLQQAVKFPRYTPYLGRRSCPITSPLFLDRISAGDPLQAYGLVDDIKGKVYSEDELPGYDRIHHLRDEPIPHLPRQFSAHRWYEKSLGGQDVS